MTAPTWRGVFAAAVAFAIVLLSPGCGGSKANGTPVAVSLKDFAVLPDRATVTSGRITFTVDNDGPSTHELAVFKTDLAASALPVVDNLVPEDSPGLELVDEAESIKADTRRRLTVDLEPGHYVLICNVLAHYQQGMRANLTVE